MLKDIRLGQLICSQAGRDRGRYYLVVGHQGDRRVQVVDGHYRPVKKPKAKNVAHIKPIGRVALDVNQQLSNGGHVTDELIRTALNRLCNDLSRKEGD
ncbi:MAG: RNA-binding protein [bacterium]|jgi:ribosomal protein L14E/L6E/L27E